MKPCLLHGCDPSCCGCPDEVSQRDFLRQQRTVAELPAIDTLSPVNHPNPGPYTLHETVVRNHRMTVTTLVAVTAGGVTIKI